MLRVLSMVTSRVYYAHTLICHYLYLAQQRQMEICLRQMKPVVFGKHSQKEHISLRRVWDGLGEKEDWADMMLIAHIDSQPAMLGFIAVGWGMRSWEMRTFLAARRPLVMIGAVIWDVLTMNQWEINQHIEHIKRTSNN